MGGDSGPESTQVQGRGVTWEGLAWQQGSGAPGGCVSHLSGEEEAQETEWPHGGGVGGRCWSQLVPSLPLELHLLIQLIARLFSSLIFRGSVQFSSVAQSCPTPCDPMDGSASGLPVHHQLPKLAQTHVH